ncbi:phospholipase B [Auriscalpium vulgare]|uniref:Phospholipase B n=1 Tax=Auriscalpium vulgare TaxID=40419 RepID=A0ACB8RP11_9AGAM|nr:phospholipase B [Auriscalpium vulgare]
MCVWESCAAINYYSATVRLGCVPKVRPYKRHAPARLAHPSMRLLPISLLALVVGVYADSNSPEDYAPQTNQPCPDIATSPLLRVFTPQNQTLHPREAGYVNSRLSKVVPVEWSNWAGDGSGIGYNLSVFGNNFTRIGIAVSGGGYRAAQYGAGVVSGFDARNESAKAAGTGGLLQVSSYFAGLSGGSWLTGSLFMNDFPTVKDMVYGNGGNLSGWKLDLALATPDGDDVFDANNQDWYGSILWSVIAKANKSIDTSLTDPWGRMISYHFLNQTSRDNFFTNDSAHGAGQLWSQVPETSTWLALQEPFPIIQADSRPVGSNLTTALAPEPVVYEITPMEFGSWDPNLSSMMNISYVGTHLNNGVPDNTTACVTGFDQASFVMGTSASLFNQILDFANNKIQGFDDSAAKSILYIIDRQLRSVRTRADDVANWPSPFQGIKPENFEDSSSRWLELIDGSSNLENVPVGQLFVKARNLDVIVAVDGSADDPTFLWPNGSSPLHSAARISSLLTSSHQSFPPLPGNTAEFLSTGVNQRPTFFGCFPTQNPPEYPMVLYFPNSPPLTGDDPVSNTGTFKLDYTAKFTQLFLDQVHANTIGGFTPGANTPDANFGKCLQCAALDRARLRLSPPLNRSDVCTQCFTQYCFDPTNKPSVSALVGRKLTFKDPDPQGAAKVEGFLSHSKLPIIGGFVGAALIIAGIIGLLIWRKRRQQRSAAYQKVVGLHDEEEEAPFMQHGIKLGDQRLSKISTRSSAYEMENVREAYSTQPELPYVPEEQTQSVPGLR